MLPEAVTQSAGMRPSSLLRRAAPIGVAFALYRCLLPELQITDGDPGEVDGTGGSSGEAGGDASGGGGTGGDAGRGGVGLGGSTGGGGTDTGGSGGSRADGRAIEIWEDGYFPEGVAVDRYGNFYIGSMGLGRIFTAKADQVQADSLIHPDDANQLVSVTGLYVDDANGILYACSSDVGNTALEDYGPPAVVAIALHDQDTPRVSYSHIARYTLPEYSGTQWTDEVPKSVNGFCNDITMDADGNLYATDSWYPRILRLAAGGEALEEWLVDDIFHPTDDPWHLNGIDIDQSTNTLYVVENHPGTLYSVPIESTGDAGTATEIIMSPRELLSPDGLKVAAPNLLVVAEGGNDGGGVSVIRVNGDEATIEPDDGGLDQVATLALRQGSAWVVENQADHFWAPEDYGPIADPPFRVVEVPLEVGGGAGVIELTTERFFPEGVTRDTDGGFYIGSMNLGLIQQVALDGTQTARLIAPTLENGLVSVIGLYADDANDLFYACSSDAGNGQNAGSAPATVVAFTLSGGAFLERYEWPVYSGTPWEDEVPINVNGFCNDLTVDGDGNLYATDSWYPRIVSLPVGGDTLEEWVISDVFPAAEPWHLNGIDYDASSNSLYVVENSPGALYRVSLLVDGRAGTVVEIATQRPLYAPDGLKVIGDGLLAVAEGDTGGMAIVEINGDTGFVRRISTGLDGVATFAMLGESAWLVENQGDHFWGGDGIETKPFRLVEIPLGAP